MCVYFSRRNLAGRGDAGQDAAAATVLLGDYHAQFTGSDLDKAVIDLGPMEACTGLTFVCLSRAKRLVDLMVEAMSFDRIGNLGNYVHGNYQVRILCRRESEAAVKRSDLAKFDPDTPLEKLGWAREEMQGTSSSP